MNATDRRNLLDNTRIASQQALLKQLVPQGVQPIKRVIPAGKTLSEQVDQQDMPRVVYTWLRGCGHFNEVKISLARNPEQISGTPERRVPFDTKDKLFWEKTATSRKELAKIIADIMNKERLVYIHVKPDGLYVAKDPTNKFAPVVAVTKQLQAAHPELADVAINTKVPNPDWEPFVEFLPKRPRVTKPVKA